KNSHHFFFDFPFLTCSFPFPLRYQFLSSSGDRRPTTTGDNHYKSMRMDSYEATKTVFSRIQAMDPDNASKIMGYLLLQDQGDNEMIRLAFGPESLLHNLILQAKSHLGLPISPTNSSSSSSSSNPSTPSSPFLSSPRPRISSSSLSYAVNQSALTQNGNGVGDEYPVHSDHQFSFLNESGKHADQLFDKMPDSALFSPTGDAASHFHRRSFSVPGVNFAADCWKPCLYYAKGFCKNGAACKFLHHSGGDASSGDEFEPSQQQQEISLMRSKSSVQQKLAAAQFMAAASGGGSNLNFPYMRAAAAGSFSPLGGPSARQIYLTFPADSTFREEDVSNYFSIYGPVQDVRIPYQQKRMFGFVTFLYPETVNLILAKGNPHFVCDSRVLVKPYKEKGKILEKKQLERGGEFSPSACSSPTGLDSRDPFDLHLGSRMFYNTQEMLLRKKLEEQADLQQAIELHGRRLMSLQLLDLKNHHRQQLIHGLSNGSPLSSPRTPVLPVPEENGASVNAAVGHHDQEKLYFTELNDLHESFEHILPENLFNSPKKASLEHHKTAFSASLELHDTNSAINMTPLKSFPQMTRLSSGHGTIGMKS
ncbi:Zinc finger CCCH domain-containing protein 22, partial [Linum grandiflorum]